MGYEISVDLELEPPTGRSARTLTRQHLGDDVEGKATDHFCVAYATPVVAPAVEAFTPAAPDVPAVLEFHPPELVVPELAVEDEAELTRRVSEVFHEYLGPAAPADSLGPLLRQLHIKGHRDAFHRQTGLVRDQLERLTSQFSHRRPSGLRGPDAERPLVQLCWLNGTLHSAQARSVSDIA